MGSGRSSWQISLGSAWVSEGFHPMASFSSGARPAWLEAVPSPGPSSHKPLAGLAPSFPGGPEQIHWSQRLGWRAVYLGHWRRPLGWRGFKQRLEGQREEGTVHTGPQRLERHGQGGLSFLPKSKDSDPCLQGSSCGFEVTLCEGPRPAMVKGPLGKWMQSFPGNPVWASSLCFGNQQIRVADSSALFVSCLTRGSREVNGPQRSASPCPAPQLAGSGVGRAIWRNVPGTEPEFPSPEMSAGH